MNRPNCVVRPPHSIALLVLTALLAAGVARPAAALEYYPGVEWPEPPVVTPAAEPGGAPSDAVVLFDGKDLSAWNGAENWKIVDGAMVVGQGEISTKQPFADCQLHIEWSAPTPATGEGQGRGNSGVFFGPYELQVLDSYKSKTYFDGQAGALYKQQPPQVNAMRPPGEWNVYDVIWTAPRFRADGSLESPAYITALHNGVLIQNHTEVKGSTFFHSPPTYWPHDSAQPIRLQDHGNPVRFRNIWIREWKPIHGKQAKPPAKRIGDKVKPIEEMQ
ncbi:MAG: DUF1080 domain-containing protein [Planctomycetales bacterium]|nr:DUF1080 domain-containing protein [Planctomycetales bacterium]